MALLLSEAVLLVSCYVAAVFLIADVDPELFLRYDNGLLRILMVVAVELLGLYLQDLYSDVKVHSGGSSSSNRSGWPSALHSSKFLRKNVEVKLCVFNYIV